MEAYKKIRPVGKGNYGAATLVEHTGEKALYVMKTVNISRLSKAERDDARNEVKVLKALEHPNVIFYRESFIHRGQLCIVMEYADGGDLEAALKARKGKLLDESTIIDWFVQICLGLKHVHDRRILHRDMKTQNIFLTKSGMLKLGDFGISKVLADTGELAKTAIGTPYYLSPEICRQAKYDHKSDIWSLGCILYEMATLKHAFEASDMRHLVIRIMKGKYPPLPRTFSKGLHNLVAEMLNVNPGSRPSVNRLLSRPVVRDRIQHLLSSAALAEPFNPPIASSVSPPRSSGEEPSGGAGAGGHPLDARRGGGRRAGAAADSAFSVVGVGARKQGGKPRAASGAQYEGQRAMALAHAQQAALLADKVRRDELAGAQAAARARVKAVNARKRQQDATVMARLRALEREASAAEEAAAHRPAADLVRAALDKVEGKRRRRRVTESEVEPAKAERRPRGARRASEMPSVQERTPGDARRRHGPRHVPKPTPKYSRKAPSYAEEVKGDRRPRRSPPDTTPPPPAPPAPKEAPPASPPPSSAKKVASKGSPSLGEWKDVFDGLDQEIMEVMRGTPVEGVESEGGVVVVQAAVGSGKATEAPVKPTPAKDRLPPEAAEAARERLAGKTAAMRRRLIADKAKVVHDDWQQKLMDMWATNGVMNRLSELRGGARRPSVPGLNLDAHPSPPPPDADRPHSARDQTEFTRTGSSLAVDRAPPHRRRSSVHLEEAPAPKTKPRQRRLSWSGSQPGAAAAAFQAKDKARRGVKGGRQEKVAAGAKELNARRAEKQRRAEEQRRKDEEHKRRQSEFEEQRRQRRREREAEAKKRAADLEKRRAAARAKYEGATFRSPTHVKASKPSPLLQPAPRESPPAAKPRRRSSVSSGGGEAAGKPRVSSAGNRRSVGGAPPLRRSSSTGNDGDTMREARRAAREAAQAELRAKIKAARAEARRVRRESNGPTDPEVQVYAKPMPPARLRPKSASPPTPDAAASLWTPAEREDLQGTVPKHGRRAGKPRRSPPDTYTPIDVEDRKPTAPSRRRMLALGDPGGARPPALDSPETAARRAARDQQRRQMREAIRKARSAKLTSPEASMGPPVEVFVPRSRPQPVVPKVHPVVAPAPAPAPPQPAKVHPVFESHAVAPERPAMVLERPAVEQTPPRAGPAGVHATPASNASERSDWRSMPLNLTLTESTAAFLSPLSPTSLPLSPPVVESPVKAALRSLDPVPEVGLPDASPPCTCDLIRGDFGRGYGREHPHHHHHHQQPQHQPHPPSRQANMEALADLVAHHDPTVLAQANARRSYDAAHRRPSTEAVRHSYPAADGGDAVPGGSPAGGFLEVSRTASRSFLAQAGAITVAGLPVQAPKAAAAVAEAMGDMPGSASGFHKAEAIRMFLEEELGASRLVQAHRLLNAPGAQSSAELDEQLLSIVGDDKANTVGLLHQLVHVEQKLV